MLQGIAIAIINVDLNDLRNTSNTIIAKNAPNIKLFLTTDIELFMYVVSVYTFVK